MKIIEVPLYNEDGSIQTVMQIPPEEAQSLLQFAINFIAATGHKSILEQLKNKDNDQTHRYP